MTSDTFRKRSVCLCLASHAQRDAEEEWEDIGDASGNTQIRSGNTYLRASVLGTAQFKMGGKQGSFVQPNGSVNQ